LKNGNCGDFGQLKVAQNGAGEHWSSRTVDVKQMLTCGLLLICSPAQKESCGRICDFRFILRSSGLRSHYGGEGTMENGLRISDFCRSCPCM